MSASPRERVERIDPEPVALRASLRLLTERLAGLSEIRAAFFHGSAERGEPFRDLDIAVLVDRERISAGDDLRYGAGLSDELSRASGYPVDVKVVNDAPPAFRDRVSRGSVLTCRSSAEVVRFKERAWDDWFDFRPVAMAYLRDMAG